MLVLLLLSSIYPGQMRSKAAGQPGLESRDGRKGSIPSLSSVEGKWQEAGRSLCKVLRRPLGPGSTPTASHPWLMESLHFEAGILRQLEK